MLCRFGLSLGPLASGLLDPTLASFCSLTLVITPKLLLTWNHPSLRSHVTRTQFLVMPPGAVIAVDFLHDLAANPELEAFIPSTCLAGDMTTSHTGAQLYLLLGSPRPEIPWDSSVEGALCLPFWGLWLL